MQENTINWYGIVYGQVPGKTGFCLIYTKRKGLTLRNAAVFVRAEVEVSADVTSAQRAYLKWLDSGRGTGPGQWQGHKTGTHHLSRRITFTPVQVDKQVNQSIKTLPVRNKMEIEIVCEVV